MIQFFVVVSVVLGIASVLAISVLQKSKQIGILKAMGIKTRQSSLIFLFQGLILGLIGGILGLIIGLGLSISFTYFCGAPRWFAGGSSIYRPQFPAPVLWPGCGRFDSGRPGTGQEVRPTGSNRGYPQWLKGQERP